jgi:DNA-binding CsgD family transcriptional regulator
VVALRNLEREEPLSFEERQTLRRLVSDQLRELKPYVESEGRHREPGWDSKPIEPPEPSKESPAVILSEPEPVGDTIADTLQARIAVARRTLTPRECEVFGYVVCGFNNGEIADKLGLRLPTVASHVKHVLEKLGARNRAHAVALVLSGPDVIRMDDGNLAVPGVTSPMPAQRLRHISRPDVGRTGAEALSLSPGAAAGELRASGCDEARY